MSVALSLHPQATLSLVRMGTCSNSAATQRWVGQSTCDTGVSHGTLSTILGSTICGFTNRAYTFLLYSIMGSSISGTPGSLSTIHPGAAWAAMPPRQDGLLP